MKQQSSYFVLILVLTHHILVEAQINWQSGAGGVQWAPACDFYNNLFKEKQEQTKGNKRLSRQEQGGSWMASRPHALNFYKISSRKYFLIQYF